MHIATFHVHADDTANAIRRLFDGDGDELLSSPQLDSVCLERGIEADVQLQAKLEQLGVVHHAFPKRSASANWIRWWRQHFSSMLCK